jgi:beta-phosphoglucomutase
MSSRLSGGCCTDLIHEGMTLLNLFYADISDRDFEHGKQHPIIFLTAPQELDFPPEHCFVVADTSLGVQACQMAVLGVARLKEAGAERVVTSLDDVAVNVLSVDRLDRATIR